MKSEAALNARTENKYMTKANAVQVQKFKII